MKVAFERLSHLLVQEVGLRLPGFNTPAEVFSFELS
jgi:hypothetical protein